MSSGVSKATIEEWRTMALKEALGHILELADPDDTNVHVGNIQGEDNDRAIREAVAPFLLSWVVGPLAAALGAEPLYPYAGGTSATLKAEKYLAEVKKSRK